MRVLVVDRESAFGVVYGAYSGIVRDACVVVVYTQSVTLTLGYKEITTLSPTLSGFYLT